jgi:hypothetical protein
MRALVLAAALGLSSPSFAQSGPTTIEEVIAVGDFISREATCKDFTDALARSRSPEAVSRDHLVALLGIHFMNGYSAGAGRLDGGLAEYMLFCIQNPGQKFLRPAP